VGLSQGDNIDLSGAVVEERASGGVNRCSCGYDILHDQDSFVV
jgi:hypothetical protein